VSAAGARWSALAVLCTALLAIVIDNTIVNVALPTLARELDADLGELQWVVDAYTLVFAALLLPAGALGDRYGRRATLVGGLALFGAASAAAAFAGDVGSLVAARAVMGAGAALIMPATLSLVSGIFTDPRERASAIGIWAATAGVGVALGPVLGGLLLDRLWWGSIFVVNVPVVVLALVGALRLVLESRDPAPRPLDWPGAALSGSGLVALVWAVIEAPSEGWTSAPTLAAAGLAAALLAAFVVRQRRAADPLLALELFRDRRFTAASGTIAVLFFALFGFLFLSTQYLQLVLGYSPSAAGVRVLPYAAAMILFALVSARLAERFGTRRVVTVGMLLFAAGLGVAATIEAGGGYGRLALSLVLLGAGMGLAGAPATESIMASLPPDRANIGSAVNDTARELGGALGVAVIGSIASSIYSSRLGGGPPGFAPEAFVHAMSRASLVAGLVTLVGALAAWISAPCAGR
jgi:EmrB/QacA subfamily drug resistance transporter